jgi:dUTP pyrophosphatase
VRIELKILDARLPGWGFPSWGSDLAAGLDLHACLDGPLILQPQAPAVLISAGIAFRIGDPEWCALVLPRSGLGHKHGLVLGNAVGVIDADYEGPCLISAWNRNPGGPLGATGKLLWSTPAGSRISDGREIEIRPGDRIAQLVFTRIARPEFTIVAEFAETGSREQSGFGSTGIEAACPDSHPR